MNDLWTWHGGALDAAKRHFGVSDAAWIDLSTGINPMRWPGAETMPIDWHRLPEPGALADLEAAAAAFFGVAARHVCAVPGTEIGLRLVGRLIGGVASHVAPGYRTHGAMFAGSAAIARDAAADRGGALVVANPNNPDGHILDLRALRAARPPHDWLLVDEAFADAQPAISVAPDVSDNGRLIVFRSFGKFFGLAGVRLGFVIAPQHLLTDLRAWLGAWPLSAAALAIGTAAYRDHEWAAAARVRLPVSAAVLDDLLRRHDLTPTGDCPLFRLVETPHARALFERLARAAILTRPFADQPQWLRFGLPADAAALARLDAALAGG
ncbi:aminotransferase class I/II-fold pyridoxal phosphate-dependent enzyme [Sphingopyxis sp. KK2]|uniref:aminotransferase class I/II-fold pyridoxal phosphate-dependent enzyme n=1 Tax=Sphingopyxis sp. KK2 TaxID=1855727 RepID=UPI00097E6694|nr:aminotransferase class I/II-fold pyridoxal phosphate-dependent enzyme [Sphingopyxis sp. KK2]